MHTGAQQRYYDVLRREDHRRPPAAASVGGSNNGSTLVSASCLASTTSKRDGAQRIDADGSACTSADASAHLWDPIEQLRLDATTVVALRELVCDHRGLTALHPNFTRFEQLDSLVLNHNTLRTLHNLLPPSHLSVSPSPVLPSSSSVSNTAANAGNSRKTASKASLYYGCRRLTHLHANHNELCDVSRDTDIPRLLLLEHLSLAHNRLTDLDAVLRPLRRLRHLRYLDLRGNPLVDEPSYRQRCVAALPQVEVLDGLTITEEERRASASVGSFSQSRLPSNAATASSEEEKDGDSASDGGGVAILPSAGTQARKKATSKSRFGKSTIAHDLDVKYAAHERQQQREQAAAIEARVAAERQKKETWEAFHAVWVLSQPGMPLSEDGWRATMAAAGAAAQASPAPSSSGTTTTIAAGVGDAAPSASTAACTNAASRPPRKSPSSSAAAAAASSAGPATRLRTPVSVRSFQPPQAAGSRPEATGSLSVSAAAAAAAAAATVQSVDVPRDRLLPPIPSQPQPLSEAQNDQHDSPYFRTIRGKGKANLEDFSTTLSTATRDPSPERFAALQQALQASADVLRAMHAHSSNTAADAACRTTSLMSSPTGATAAFAAEFRKFGRSSLAPASAASSLSPLAAGKASAATCPVELAALCTIQQNKYALIPPPWEREEEREEGGGNAVSNTQRGTATMTHLRSLGGVEKKTVVQEAIVEVLVLLHQLFSAEELQLLEMEYGRAELLRLLPLPEWSATTTAAAAAEDTTSPLDTLNEARQAMLLLLRPGTAAATSSGAGTGSGGASANNSGGGGGRRLVSEERKKAAGAGGRGGGGTQSGAFATSSTISGFLGSSGGSNTNGLTASEMAAAAMTAARAVLPTEPELVWDLFEQPFIAAPAAALATAASSSSRGAVLAQGKSGEAAVNPANSCSSSSSSSSSSSGAAATGAASSAAAIINTTSTTATDEVTLRDAEAVQQLVRPIGPYEGRVLSSVLKLLKPAPVLDAEELCESLRHSHEVVQRAAVTVVSRAKGATAQAGSEAEASENKKGRAARGNAVATAHHGCGHEQAGLKSLSPAMTPQLSLVTVLTALLFHPGFVRARLEHWEQELVRMTMAATAAAPTATTPQVAKGDSRVGSGGVSGTKGNVAPSPVAGIPQQPITPLFRLFHRVQDLKSHVARVEHAAAAKEVGAVTEGSSGEARPCCVVQPSQVLIAYQ